MANLYPTSAAYSPVPTVAPGASASGLVLASTNPGWPAPLPQQQAQDVDERTAKTIAAAPSNAGRVISESIFGGSVTAGDPAVVTTTISPYTNKVEPVRRAGESWTDVFGRGHGTPVPANVRFYAGRRSHSPAPTEGLGAFAMPSYAKYVAIGAAVLGGLFFYKKYARKGA